MKWMSKESVRIIGREIDGKWSESTSTIDDITRIMSNGKLESLKIVATKTDPTFRERTYEYATITLCQFHKVVDPEYISPIIEFLKEECLPASLTQ